MNLASNVARSAQAHPDRAALRLGDDITSYRELDEDSAETANTLSEVRLVAVWVFAETARDLERSV